MAKVWTSPVTAVASTITLDAEDLFNFPHVFASFAYYSDAAGTTPAVPGAGTIEVSGRIKGSIGYAPFADPTVDCTDIADTSNVAQPMDSVKAVPTGITTATYYRMTVVANVS